MWTLRLASAVFVGLAFAAEECHSPPGGVAPGTDVCSTCCHWAAHDECDSNASWMRPYCQESCGTTNCRPGEHHNCRVTVHPSCRNERHNEPAIRRPKAPPPPPPPSAAKFQATAHRTPTQQEAPKAKRKVVVNVIMDKPTALHGIQQPQYPIMQQPQMPTMPMMGGNNRMGLLIPFGGSGSAQQPHDSVYIPRLPAIPQGPHHRVQAPGFQPISQFQQPQMPQMQQRQQPQIIMMMQQPQQQMMMPHMQQPRMTMPQFTSPVQQPRTGGRGMKAVLMIPLNGDGNGSGIGDRAGLLILPNKKTATVSKKAKNVKTSAQSRAVAAAAARAQQLKRQRAIRKAKNARVITT